MPAQALDFMYSSQASAEHFEQCAEFALLRNCRLGALAVTVPLGAAGRSLVEPGRQVFSTPTAVSHAADHHAAISVPAGETHVLKHFQARMPYGLVMPDVP
jgi:hypothetical protein